jgi:hypothetical protein
MTIVPLILISSSRTHGASFCSGSSTGSPTAAQKHRREGEAASPGCGRGEGLPQGRGAASRPGIQGVVAALGAGRPPASRRAPAGRWWRRPAAAHRRRRDPGLGRGSRRGEATTPARKSACAYWAAAAPPCRGSLAASAYRSRRPSAGPSDSRPRVVLFLWVPGCVAAGRARRAPRLAEVLLSTRR